VQAIAALLEDVKKPIFKTTPGTRPLRHPDHRNIFICLCSCRDVDAHVSSIVVACVAGTDGWESALTNPVSPVTASCRPDRAVQRLCFDVDVVESDWCTRRVRFCVCF